MNWNELAALALDMRSFATQIDAAPDDQQYTDDQQDALEEARHEAMRLFDAIDAVFETLEQGGQS